GRSQRGNNNAYAQDNATTWLDWADAGRDLIAFVAELARLRKALPALSDDSFLSGAPPDASGIPDVVWLCPTGPMADSDWHENRSFGAALYTPATPDTPASRTAFWINGTDTPALPQ